MVASEKAPAYSSLINLAGTPPTPVRIGADAHGRENQIRTLGRIHVVVQRGDDAIVPDERAVADVYAALVLEAAAGVDEHALAQVRVQPAVGRERRK